MALALRFQSLPEEMQGLILDGLISNWDYTWRERYKFRIPGKRVPDLVIPRIFGWNRSHLAIQVGWELDWSASTKEKMDYLTLLENNGYFYKSQTELHVKLLGGHTFLCFKSTRHHQSSQISRHGRGY